MSNKQLTPLAPHLVKATYNWLLENNETPQILVNALRSGVDVPISYVKNGQIVLNLSMTATDQLMFGEDAITCRSRFNGKSMSIVVPYLAILSVFSRESNVGMMIPQEGPASQEAETPEPATPVAETAAAADIPPPAPEEGKSNVTPFRRGHLSVVK